MPNFGEVLRRTRRKCHMTLAQLADELDISIAYLSDVERGNRPPFTDERIVASADVLAIDPDVLRTAAAHSRGVFQFDPDAVSDRAVEVGAALTRKLPTMTDAQLDRLMKEFLEDE